MDYYKDIDELPMWNWNKVHDTGNYVYLYKESDYKKEVKEEWAVKVWDEIYDQYLDYFGIGEKYIEYMRKRITIGKLIADQIVTENRTLNTHIRARKRELEDFKKENMKGDFTQTHAAVVKHMGQRVNLKETTVKEFYSYVKLMTNG